MRRWKYTASLLLLKGDENPEIKLFCSITAHQAGEYCTFLIEDAFQVIFQELS